MESFVVPTVVMSIVLLLVRVIRAGPSRRICGDCRIMRRARHAERRARAVGGCWAGATNALNN